MTWARLPRPPMPINQSHISMVGQVHTKIAGKKDTNVTVRLIYATMVVALSVRESVFVKSFDIATNIVPPRTSQVPIPISAKPGRRIISMPIKPMEIDTQRMSFDGSFMKTMAPIEAKNGTIKLSAVASAKGIIVRAQNQVIIAVA